MSNDEHSSNNTVTVVPTDTSNNPLLWDGEIAHIKGNLRVFWQWCLRTGRHVQMIRNRVAVLSNAKMAVSSVVTVPFVLGKIKETRDIFTMCPPEAADRIAEFDAKAAAATPPAPTFSFADYVAPRGPAFSSTWDELSADVKYTFVENPIAVEASESKLFNDLVTVFGSAELSPEIIEEAEGKAYTFVQILLRLVANASPADIALATAQHTRLVQRGVTTTLRVESLQAFLKAYKHSTINLDDSALPTAASEVQMIALIAYKDATVRAEYNLTARANPPTTLATASTMLLNILRQNEKFSKIEDASMEGAVPALATTKADEMLAEMRALATKLGTADPNKNRRDDGRPPPRGRGPRRNGGGRGRGRGGNGNDANKIEVPRDADGNPNKWVEGMSLCNCGINGGKHLFSECPKKKAAAEAAAKAKADADKAALAAKAEADKAALAAKSLNLEGLDGDALIAALGKQLQGWLSADNAKVGSAKVVELVDAECTECDDDECAAAGPRLPPLSSHTSLSPTRSDLVSPSPAGDSRSLRCPRRLKTWSISASSCTDTATLSLDRLICTHRQQERARRLVQPRASRQDEARGPTSFFC
jgi:hypothetical protein